MASTTKRTTKSGHTKYDVRYRDPTGAQRKQTFSTRRSADRFARTVEVEKETGRYVDPQAGQVTFGEYSTRWLSHKPDLRPRTREVYEDIIRLHLVSAFGDSTLSGIRPTAVREWWADLHHKGLAQATNAKIYRLLRSILATAESDELIARNPCRIEGAAVERSAERPVATIDQVWALADGMPGNLRCGVLLNGFIGLRLGEMLGLERRHVNLLHAEIRVEQQVQQLRDGSMVVLPPKTEAGVRTLAVPAAVLDEAARHLDRYTDAQPDSRLFTVGEEEPLGRKQWQRAFSAAKARVEDLPVGFRAHDLRHTANTITATTGASTRELMARMGHSSPAAALRYQHATRDRDHQIAALVGDLVAPTGT